MNAEERRNSLRLWSGLSRTRKDAYFRSFFPPGEEPIEIPDAYRKCMERCTNKHRKMLERCDKLDGQDAFDCAQRIEEEMMHCYDGCSAMI